MKIAQAIATEGGWGEITNKSLERGIGGREGAMIRLGVEWAKLGHEVTNYVPTVTPQRFPVEGGGFYEFIPFKMAKTMLCAFEYDAVVAWECPSVYADPRIVDRQPVRLVEMQCAHFPHFEQEASDEFATGVCALSPWHAGFLEHSGAAGPFHVLPNGVDLALYPLLSKIEIDRKFKSRKFVYSSSPDRGLVHLLKMWPRIKENWPEATLAVGYGARRWLQNQIWSHYRQGEMAVEMTLLMEQDGVTDAGIMSPSQLSLYQLESGLLLYPCNTMSPTETGCITVIESMAASTPVVTTDCDCLEEEFGDVAAIVPLPFDEDDYLTTVEAILSDCKLYDEMAHAGREFAEGRQWKLIAPQWIKLFESERSRS